MTLDAWTEHLDALYEEHGVPADVPDGEGLTIIDKTAGIDVSAGDGDIRQQTLRPAAVVRRAELADRTIDPDSLVRGPITFNGATWKIVSWKPRPGPFGEATGEALLLLSEA